MYTVHVWLHDILLFRNHNIRVILGGGRVNFMHQNDSDPEYPEINGKRLDGNLLEVSSWENTLKLDMLTENKVWELNPLTFLYFKEWLEIREESGLLPGQYSLVYDKEDFDAADEETTEYLMGKRESSK